MVMLIIKVSDRQLPRRIGDENGISEIDNHPVKEGTRTYLKHLKHLITDNRQPPRKRGDENS